MHTQWRLQRRERQQHSAMAGAGSALLSHYNASALPKRSPALLARSALRRIWHSLADSARDDVSSESGPVARLCSNVPCVSLVVKSYYYSILDSTRLLYDRRIQMPPARYQQPSGDDPHPGPPMSWAADVVGFAEALNLALRDPARLRSCPPAN